MYENNSNHLNSCKKCNSTCNTLTLDMLEDSTDQNNILSRTDAYVRYH